MKRLALIILAFIVFMSIYFMISTVGMLWKLNYNDIISNPDWFIIYAAFIGWWTTALVIEEVYDSIY